jgi:hypothetical protein
VKQVAVAHELRVAMSPIPRSESTELEIQFEGREIGALTLQPGDLAEFIEGLREGFQVSFTLPESERQRQKRADVAEFAGDVCDTDDD